MRALLVVAAALAPPPDSAEPPDVRPAIDRGLAFLAKDALAWKAEKKCASCHHAPMALWALGEAATAGYTADPAAVAELAGWVADPADSAKVFPAGAAEAAAVNQAALMLALGLEASGGGEPAEAAKAKALAAVLGKQNEDGSWAVLYEWPPIAAPPDVVTGLSLLALSSPAAPTDLGPAGAEARRKGEAWLAAAAPPADAESAAVRLLVATRPGRPASEREGPAAWLAADQNADGGWGQTPEAASDAYATGQALYALAVSGRGPDDPALVRGRRYLASSQQADGSWPMASRPGRPRGEPAGDLRPIAYAGSAWAVLGLVRSAPRP